MTTPSPSRAQVEQIISVSRLALAAAALFAVWMDPTDIVGVAYITNAVQIGYVAYALVLIAMAWRRRITPPIAFAIHVIDLAVFAVLQYLTQGPSSPFFIYMLFSMFCGALRWGWTGTLITSAVVIGHFGMTTIIATTLGMPTDLNRVITRFVYLLMATCMLVYLGRYEARLRDEIERLARWPTAAGNNLERGTQAIVEHAARIVDARRATIVWEAVEEPRVHVATWSNDRLRLGELPPNTLAGMLPESLATRTLVISGPLSPDAPVMVSDERGVIIDRAARPLAAAFFEIVSGTGMSSAPFKTERLAGRAFFSDLATRSGELAALTAVVAREIGTWLDQLHVNQQLQEIATREERLRLARDLHDGVLQSLTGIRFELRSVANALGDHAQDVRARLFALERALSIEQRELRYFIGGLKPGAASAPPPTSLAGRLDALRERFALEWNTPVAIRVSPELQDTPPELTKAIPLMVHEAVVNALKHAQPTRVNVNVDGATDRLRIVVSDDGHGFPFKGRFDHRALDEARSAPRSLFDRVTALGGKMSIESSDTGSRVEMVVSL
jgi:signal transduction histidine kinase